MVGTMRMEAQAIDFTLIHPVKEVRVLCTIKLGNNKELFYQLGGEANTLRKM